MQSNINYEKIGNESDVYAYVGFFFLSKLAMYLLEDFKHYIKRKKNTKIFVHVSSFYIIYI